MPSITDIEGNSYPLVTICNQTWTKTNLNVSKYRNGDIIPQVTDATQWAALTTGAWCYYANISSNGITYGKLYNWYAVNDARGLAPAGYHIPTDAEWTSLTTCLGGETIAGGKMKSTDTSLWQSPNTNATNSSNFTGLPSGIRNNINNITFSSINQYTGFWSVTENNTSLAWYRALGFNGGNVQRGIDTKQTGLSVRCLKD